MVAQGMGLLGKLTLIRLVGQYGTQPTCASRSHDGSRRQQDVGRAAIMPVGGVYGRLPDMPTRVAKHLTLAAVDAFVGIGAPLLAQARGQLDALRID
jgi:hypothetical protein